MVSIWGAEVKAFFCTVPCLDPPAISTMMESEGGEKRYCDGRPLSFFLLLSPLICSKPEARGIAQSKNIVLVQPVNNLPN